MGIRQIIVIALALIASGCATPYTGGMTIMGGVKATKLDDTTMRISGLGNGYTSRERIADYVLLKAAQETLMAGYGHFAVIDGDQYDLRSTYTTPMSSSTTVNVVGNTAYANTNYYGGQTFLISRPKANSVIKMYTGPKPANAPPGVYDAADIVKYLGAEYNIESGTSEAEATESTDTPAGEEAEETTAASAESDAGIGEAGATETVDEGNVVNVNNAPSDVDPATGMPKPN